MKTNKDIHSLSWELYLGHPKHKGLSCNI